MYQHFVELRTINGVEIDAHPSMQRLLEHARRVTAGTPSPVMDWRSLLIRLQASPATITNWKRRGLSKEGALAAEREFGCSAAWLLDGDAAAPGPTVRAEEPAATYANPADALDKLRALLAQVPEPMRDAFIDILDAWARTGGVDEQRRATLLHLAAGPQKLQRHARA